MNIKNLKDTHLGEKCFVLGNGPSINDVDISKLLDKNVIVTNCFHQHQLWSKFKRIYHVELNGAFRIHPNVTKWKVSNLLKNKNATYILREKFKDIWLNTLLPKERCYFLKLDNSKSIMDGNYEWDITRGSVWGNSGVIEGSMAVAQYMGFKNIFLIGCDVSGFNDRNGYFYNWTKIPNVYHPREGDKHDFNEINKSWKVLSQKFKERGISIHNLAEYSKLEYFEKLNFDSVV